MSDLTPTEEAELDAAIDTLASGGVALLVAMLGAALAWWVDSWTLDLVFLLGSMAAAIGAVIAGVRGRRWLIVVHGLALVLLDVIVLVSAPL